MAMTPLLLLVHDKLLRGGRAAADERADDAIDEEAAR